MIRGKPTPGLVFLPVPFFHASCDFVGAHETHGEHFTPESIEYGGLAGAYSLCTLQFLSRRSRINWRASQEEKRPPRLTSRPVKTCLVASFCTAHPQRHTRYVRTSKTQRKTKTNRHSQCFMPVVRRTYIFRFPTCNGAQRR